MNTAIECGHCGSHHTQVHCPSRQCTWIRCDNCGLNTDTRKK